MNSPTLSADISSLVLRWPCGWLHITASKEGLRQLLFLNCCPPALPPAPSPQTMQILQETARQLDDYFTHKRQLFDLPLATSGTDFQSRVWEKLKAIKWGETTTYGDLAAACAHPHAARAVGSALKANPLPIIIPCHRVLPASGKLGGFSGGQEIKRYLLQQEMPHRLV